MLAHFLYFCRRHQQHHPSQRLFEAFLHPHHEAGRRDKGLHPRSIPCPECLPGHVLGPGGDRHACGPAFLHQKGIRPALRDIQSRPAARGDGDCLRERNHHMSAEHLFRRGQARVALQGRTLLLEHQSNSCHGFRRERKQHR